MTLELVVLFHGNHHPGNNIEKDFCYDLLLSPDHFEHYVFGE
jgi:hypothetical protein